MQVIFMFFLVSLSISIALCLKPNRQDHHHHHEGKRLIKTSDDSPSVWMTQEEIHNLFECPFNHFVDVTNDPSFSLEDAPEPNADSIPRSPRFQPTVNGLISRINQSRLYEFVRHFSEDYSTRHYLTDEGEACEKWLFAEVTSVLDNYHGLSSVAEVNHTWRQNSVIARLHGGDPAVSPERVIFGAHIDSQSFEEYYDNGTIHVRAPGADDDATGSAILMEMLRVLVEGDIHPRRTIEFHWYAAEEFGLLGSMDIARSYKMADVPVASMLQFDIPGFQGPNITDIGIYTDELHVDAEMAQFARVLTDEYLDFGYRNWTCGYACSDHDSWTSKGYPALFVGEIEWRKWDEGCHYHHTVNDTVDKISFTQVTEMVKIGLGFAVEIGEPNN